MEIYINIPMKRSKNGNKLYISTCGYIVMATVKNLADAATITLAFYFGSLFLNGAGVDFAKDSIFTAGGAMVTFLLAFMETTYNRF